MRLLPGRRRDAALPAADGPRRGAGRAGRGLLQGERPLARPGRAAHVLAGRRARPLHGGAVARRAAAPPGQDRARRRQALLPRGAAVLRHRLRHPGRRGARGELPGERPALDGRAGSDRAERRPVRARDRTRRRAAGDRLRDRRRGRPPLARRRRDRSHHVLHEHVQPGRDDRRRPAREEGDRARPAPQAVGEDEPRSRLEGRDRVLRQGRADAVPRGARLPHRRLRLHDLHRQLWPAARSRLAGHRRRATSSPAPCSPATATSRRACTRR